MNCGSILTHSIPSLQTTDSVASARNLMEDTGFEDLPVVEDGSYKGLLVLSDLELIEDQRPISELTDHFSPVFVREQDFFLTALKKIQENRIHCLPVLSISGEYLGSITNDNIIDEASRYLSASEPGGIVILQMPPQQFSISELGRIVESNNAKILHLTTWTDHGVGDLMVSIKLNKIDIQDILASFERYQFTVYQYFGENLSEDTLKNNFDNLMNYLRF
jgi:acetoin utilization protein AcuB